MNDTITEQLAALRRLIDEGAFRRQVLNDIAAAAAEAGGAARDDTIRALLTDGWGDDPVVHGYLSVTSGALVESGGDPSIGSSVLLDRLAEGFAAIRDGGEAMAAAMQGDAYDKDALTPVQRRWVEGFSLHVVGAMARLARSPAVRAEARAHRRLVEAVGAVWPRVHEAHAYYIATVLALFDDAPFLVVDVAERRVTRYRAFGGHNLGEMLVALSRPHDEFDGESFTLPARFLSWDSLSRVDGSVVAAREAQTLSVSAHPSSIPRFEGLPVIVRAPGESVVSTELYYTIHEYLTASVQAEGDLDASEATALLARMARTADAAPPPSREAAEAGNGEDHAAAGQVRMVVIHPDGTVEGSLTDPLAQSMVASMANARK